MPVSLSPEILDGKMSERLVRLGVLPIWARLLAAACLCWPVFFFSVFFSTIGYSVLVSSIDIIVIVSSNLFVAEDSISVLVSSIGAYFVAKNAFIWFVQRTPMTEFFLRLIPLPPPQSTSCR